MFKDAAVLMRSVDPKLIFGQIFSEECALDMGVQTRERASIVMYKPYGEQITYPND